MSKSPPSYERLGAFYLGRRYDAERQQVLPEPILYDAKDLTTHALCVGMTGSGKTGLGISLLEEAAIDGVPVIAIDPKGDLGNLMLAFPKLRPADFAPWIDPAEAAREGRTPEEQAAFTAELWRSGLAEWDQEPARIGRFAQSSERRLYTPGGSAGLQLQLLRSFNAPPAALSSDTEALRERVLAAVSALLSLLGSDADPLHSREHVLLSALVARAWDEGRDLDLPTLIHQVQRPPLERIGVMDLETAFPAADRFKLAMALNNLLASPGFAAWSEGEPLDVGRLLYGPNGRPRLSILSIAHLGERERMFFVTVLLNEILSWMRSQPGSRSLRALLYMDEIFGYFPPTANPPAKTPMLTLLKQARAYGLGVVLATQNPVDLDYKGLANTGTWFLGRLQTERDKLRVLDGLEGASAATGSRFDRATMDRMLSGLPSRVFLMNNVHEDEPILMHTRWALSYLAGPLTRAQIRTLRGAEPAPATPSPTPEARKRPATAAPPPAEPRPTLPAGVAERFAPVTRPPAAGERLVYRPALLGEAELHYANARLDLDEWERGTWLAPLEKSLRGSPWADARDVGAALPEGESEPEPGAAYAPLPASALRKKSYARWASMLKTHAYRERPLELLRCGEPRLTSLPGESEDEFRGRLRDTLREERDVALEKLRSRYTPKLSRLQEQIRRAEQRVDVEEGQYEQGKLQTMVSVGTTVLGALFGRKLGSAENVRRAGGAIGRAGRAKKERDDIGRAEERVELLEKRLEELEAAFQDDIAPLQERIDPDALECEPLIVRARKSDLDVATPILLWLPEAVDASGRSRPAGEL